MSSNHPPAGLNNHQIKLVQDILSSYLEHFGRSKIYFFGSRATGKHRKYSDLDLWIETEVPLTSKDIEELSTHFEDSDLSISVDIVTPQTCLPEYEDHIRAEKIFWFDLGHQR